MLAAPTLGELLAKEHSSPHDIPSAATVMAISDEMRNVGNAPSSSFLAPAPFTTSREAESTADSATRTSRDKEPRFILPSVVSQSSPSQIVLLPEGDEGGNI